MDLDSDGEWPLGGFGEAERHRERMAALGTMMIVRRTGKLVFS